MNREEIKFMVASARYNKGTPIMADDDFELLRAKLRAAERASSRRASMNRARETPAPEKTDSAAGIILSGTAPTVAMAKLMM